MSIREDERREAIWLARGFEPCIWCQSWTNNPDHEKTCKEAPATCQFCPYVAPRATLVEGLCPDCLTLSDVERHADEAYLLALKADEITPATLERCKLLCRLAWEGMGALRQMGRHEMAREAEEMFELIAQSYLPTVAAAVERLERVA